MTQTLLLIDDDEDALESLTVALRRTLQLDCIFAAKSVEKAQSLFRKNCVDVVILDLCIEKPSGVSSGIALLQELLAIDPCTRILVLTGHDSTENGVACITLGAANFLAKPADIQHLCALVQDAFKQSALRRSLQELQRQNAKQQLEKLIGTGTQMNRLREQLHCAAASNQPVLLCGETGTGKGVCAQLIHKLSNRNKASFIRYQPHFTSAEMIHSDLFGHEPGSFTGAHSRRKGLLLEVDGGTLFLDEIDELPVQTQIALLGALQDKHFRPLGASRDSSSSFRLISACNRPIKAALQQGRIRSDFYHRIAHITITIPPLRERTQDIIELGNYCLQSLAEREQSAVSTLSAAALKKLQQYHWPGNVRELLASVEASMHRARYDDRHTIQASDIHLELCSDLQSTDGHSLQEQTKQFRHTLAVTTLRKYGNNQSKAAAALRINRATLRRILSQESRATFQKQ